MTMWRLNKMGRDWNAAGRRLAIVSAVSAVALAAVLLPGATPAPAPEQGKEPATYGFVTASLVEGENWRTGLGFDVRELWKYDEPSQRWEQVKLGPSRGLGVKPADKSANDGEGTRLLLDLSAVLPASEVGLFYLKWSLGGCPGGTLIYAGKFSPNDLHIGEPPPGMIVTGVPVIDGPRKTFGAKAAFVPDPRIHCVPTATKPTTATEGRGRPRSSRSGHKGTNKSEDRRGQA